MDYSGLNEYINNNENIQNAINEAQQNMNNSTSNTNEGQTSNSATDLNDKLDTDVENPFDPIVLMDPTISPIYIADIGNMSYKVIDPGDVSSDMIDRQRGIESSVELIDGVTVPKIQIGSMVFRSEDILEVNLDYQYFTPTIYVKVKIDIIRKSFPILSPNSIIRIVIRPSTDGKYKKIGWEFSITNSNYTYNTLEVSGTLRFNPINESIKGSGILSIEQDTLIDNIYKTKNIEYNYDSKPNKGDMDFSAYVDELTGRKKIYELSCCDALFEIAYETGLGFSATDVCLNSNNRKIIRSACTPYYMIIQECVRTLGSPTHIYDAWIDPYGYLTLVDIFYMFNAPISGEDLSIDAETGIYSQMHGGPKQSFLKTNRVLTNSKNMGVPSNMLIDDFLLINNSNVVHKDGTSQSNKYYCPIETTEPSESLVNGINSSNEISNDNIESSEENNISDESNAESNAESSKQSILDMSATTAINDSIPEPEDNGGLTLVDIELKQSSSKEALKIQNNKVPIITSRKNFTQLIQRDISNKFIKNLRQVKLRVTLVTPNYGLLRGQWVQVALVDYDNTAKMKNMYDISKVYEVIDGQTFFYPDIDGVMESKNRSKIAMEEQTGVPNFELSDLYYIDGMRFVYSSKNPGKIKQILYLIKRSRNDNR